MNKNKIFNKIAKYMLVAMLALLPNAGWGLTETSKDLIANGTSLNFPVTTLSEYIGNGDYWALSVIDSEGVVVEDLSVWTVTQNGFEVSASGQFVKVNKLSYDLTWQSLSLTAPSTISSLAHFQFVLLVSKDESFYSNPSEAIAEKKVIFNMRSKDDLPIFADYKGTKATEKLCTVEDTNNLGGTIEVLDMGKLLLGLDIWQSNASSNGLSTTNSPFYLRFAILDAYGKEISDVSNFTWKMNGKEIAATQLSNYDWSLSCYKNKKGFYCFHNQNEQNTSVSFDDLKFSFACPSDKKICDYSIVAYVSNVKPTISDNLVMSEPELIGMVKFPILLQSVLDNLTFEATDESSIDASKVNDFRQAFLSKTANVKLLTDENKARLCKALSVNDLSEVSDLYVRWKVTDSNGDAISGITASGLTLRKDQISDKEVYYTWYSTNAGSTMNAALNPTFTFPSTLDWNNLRVSCVVSKTPLVEDVNVKYGVMIKEPESFDIKFNVSLEEAPLLNDLDANYSQNLKEKKFYVNATTLASKQLIFTELPSLVEEFNLFQKDADGSNMEVSSDKSLYYRVSVIDKSTNLLVSSVGFNEVDKNGVISGIINANSFQYGNKYKKSKGLFYSSKELTAVPIENLYFALGFSNADMTKCRVEILVSDEAPTLEENQVVYEPTIKGKVVYDIVNAADAPFKHYKGYANADGDFEVIDASKGQLRQKVSKWEYTYVVDDTAPNNAVSLLLPFEDYEKNGHDLEPLGYFRWYDYDTDNASPYLTKEGGDASLLYSVKDGYNNDKGLLAYNVPNGTHANHTSVGVIFTRPSDSNWTGETVACDVSRYVDGMDETGSYLEHESTLSIRFIFHIIPKSQMADQIKERLVNPTNDLTLEDGKNVTVGLKDDAAPMTLRVNLADPTMYYFHPMTNAKKHVYYPETEESTRRIAEEDFSDEIVKPTKLIWRVYNKDKSRFAELGEGNVKDFPRFYDVALKTLNYGLTWKDLDGNDTSDKPQFTWGDYFDIVAFAADENGNSAPIANFNCRVFNYYPKRLAEMDNSDITRRVAYLDQNYKNVAIVSFDNDSPDLTLSAPTNSDDNQSQHPSNWDKRCYGFVYRDLIAKSAGGINAGIYVNPKHSALHGEYGIYKTANVKGYSSNDDGYQWYLSTKEIHDITYERSGKSQYGSFLYVDASDESRTIATATFSADLCTGQQMAFSAGINSITSNASTEPQIMFKLYGIEKDADGVEKSRTLLHTFSSGDFSGNTNSLQRGEWYQVFGKVTLQKEAGVERFSDFRIEIDNYSKGTLGADYCVDDIRIYVKPAKIEVYQDRPACGNTETGNIKLKIRAIHETLNALLGHKDTKIHFRFVNEGGTPVTGDGLYNYTLQGPDDTEPKNITTDKSYASVDVFDSEATCSSYKIDGVSMIETDADGETYIILGNHNFPLLKGKKYYVSVCTDSDPDAADAKWGNPADVCSIYSDWFQLIGQTPAITDSEGNVITEYRVDCSDKDAEVKLVGTLTTIDPNTGEKVTLTDVPFYWYLDGIGDDKCLNKDAASKNITLTAASASDVANKKISFGSHTIYLKPAGTEVNGEKVYTVGSVSYLLCDEATPLPLRVSKAGPQLNFGFRDVDYPFKDSGYEASLRVGLPQIKALLKQHKVDSSKGYLLVPLHSASYKTDVEDKTLTFINDNEQLVAASTDVYVVSSNDPTWNKEGANLLNVKVVATLKSKSIDEVGANGAQSTLDLAFSDEVVNTTDETQSLFHEGYWYELRFVYEQRGENDNTTNCPGESYLKLKIVPEYVTWYPTANNGMNANWNNDANWHRSNSAELYKSDYTEYNSYVDNGVNAEAASKVDIPTIDNYVPMKFTKVTIDSLKGLPFPDLGNIVYRSTNAIATKLTNVKGNEATNYIQYDIMAYWDESDADKGLGKQAVWNGSSYTASDMASDHKGDMSCEKFYGNTCHQIYFKPQGELRDQCYLVYDKAWVEKELKPNTWYTMSTPLQYIYAGDMYVPASDGRQTTEAFTDIKFSDTSDGTTSGKALYSRRDYPVYQRAWEKSDVQEIIPNGNYSAAHYPSEVTASNVEVKLGYWSHIYNKVDESYASGGDALTFGGFAIKAGNSLLPKDHTENALLRLPKEDKSYNYYDYQNNASGSPSTVEKTDGKHGKLLVAYNNEEKHLAPMTQSLANADGNSGFYLVANPYTCSISLKKFFDVNTDLQKAVWLIEESNVKSVLAEDLADKDFAIQPTQSFFVKKNEGSSVAEVKFTSAMYVDRLITSGLQMASDYVKSVNISVQNAKGIKSLARISVRPEASDDYDDKEDVDLFYDQNLKDVPQVYTVAGGEAVAVNAVPEISWMPLGVVSAERQDVKLSLTGIAKLSAPLYLYDAATASYTEMHDGEAVNVEAGEHGRYFLTQTRGAVTDIDRINAEDSNNLIKVYSPGAGMIVVSALADETLGRVEVFTLDGKLVHGYQLQGKQRMILRVPSGIFLVKASLSSGGKPCSKKVAVR